MVGFWSEVLVDMEIFIEKTGEKKKIKFNGTVSKLLSSLGFNSESVIVIKNSEVVTEDERLSDEDKIKILSVISGG